jgi:hypothetical protein
MRQLLVPDGIAERGGYMFLPHNGIEGLRTVFPG